MKIDNEVELTYSEDYQGGSGWLEIKLKNGFWKISYEYRSFFYNLICELSCDFKIHRKKRIRTYVSRYF
ncbi:MAG: hypothetical protein QXY18_03190 [Nitrososphaerota archaeon]